MSGIKEPDLAHFLRCIRSRLGGAGVLAQFLRCIRSRLGGAGVLAQFAGVGRCHLSSMLHGDSARGVYTWPKVRRQVTAVEWSFLEQCSAWNLFKQVHPLIADQVRHTPTVDDRDNPLMQVVCGDCGDALKLLKCVAGQGGKVSHGLCPACFTKKMTGIISADEISRRIQRDAIADHQNPAFVPLREPTLFSPDKP